MKTSQNIYQRIVAREHVARLLSALRRYDATTYYHSCRTAELALQLGAGQIGPTDLELLGEAALLHDIGKMMIDRSILNKPGKLTTAEFETMKQHARYGEGIAKSFGAKEKVLHLIRNHHPEDHNRHLELNDPLLKFLIKADNLDAWTHERPYKQPFSNQEVIELLYNRFHDDPSNEEAIRIIW